MSTTCEHPTVQPTSQPQPIRSAIVYAIGTADYFGTDPVAKGNLGSIARLCGKILGIPPDGIYRLGKALSRIPSNPQRHTIDRETLVNVIYGEITSNPPLGESEMIRHAIEYAVSILNDLSPRTDGKVKTLNVVYACGRILGLDRAGVERLRAVENRVKDRSMAILAEREPLIDSLHAEVLAIVGSEEVERIRREMN